MGGIHGQEYERWAIITKSMFEILHFFNCSEYKKVLLCHFIWNYSVHGLVLFQNALPHNTRKIQNTIYITQKAMSATRSGRLVMADRYCVKKCGSAIWQVVAKLYTHDCCLLSFSSINIKHPWNIGAVERIIWNKTK